MKKLIALALICAGLLFLQSPYSLSEVSALYEGTYTFYTMEQFEDDRVDIVQSGNGFLINCDNNLASEIYNSLNKEYLQGESFSFSGDVQDVYSILSNLNVTQNKVEQFSDLYIVYGYSPLLENSVEVDGEQINIQVALRENIVTIGTPLILGSY